MYRDIKIRLVNIDPGQMFTVKGILTSFQSPNDNEYDIILCKNFGLPELAVLRWL